MTWFLTFCALLTCTALTKLGKQDHRAKSALCFDQSQTSTVADWNDPLHLSSISDPSTTHAVMIETTQLIVLLLG